MLIHSRVTSLGRESVPGLGLPGSLGVRPPGVGRLGRLVLAALRAGCAAGVTLYGGTRGARLACR